MIVIVRGISVNSAIYLHFKIGFALRIHFYYLLPCTANCTIIEKYDLFLIGTSPSALNINSAKILKRNRVNNENSDATYRNNKLPTSACRIIGKTFDFLSYITCSLIKKLTRQIETSIYNH